MDEELADHIEALGEVEQEIWRAALDIRHMDGPRVRQCLSFWPDYVSTYGREAVIAASELPFRKRLTAREISRIDRVIGWLARQRGRSGRLIWARLSTGYGKPPGWRRLGRVMGLHHLTVKRIYKDGIASIERRISMDNQ